MFNMYIIYSTYDMYVCMYVCICNVYNMYNAFIFNIYLYKKKNNYTICNKFYFYNTLFI